MVAVSAIEENPLAGVKGLNRFLLCTEGGADRENAVRICQWHEARWGIEEYFRALKTGCRVEERQLDHADDLLKCLAFDAITAWRVFDLQRAAKAEPTRPAAEMVEPDELEVRQLLPHEIDPRCPIHPPPTSPSSTTLSASAASPDSAPPGDNPYPAPKNSGKPPSHS